MAKAKWNNTVIAECDNAIAFDNNTYFPPDSLKKEFLRECDATTVCGWKGTANYYDIVVGDEVNEQAGWYYADPKPDAAQVKGCVAFWKGVEVSA